VDRGLHHADRGAPARADPVAPVKGIQLARIQAASLGPISGTDVPDAKKRRVTVRLMVDQE